MQRLQRFVLLSFLPVQRLVAFGNSESPIIGKGILLDVSHNLLVQPCRCSLLEAIDYHGADASISTGLVKYQAGYQFSSLAPRREEVSTCLEHGAVGNMIGSCMVG